MNIDALIVANYMWKVPDYIVSTMEAAFDNDPKIDHQKVAITLALYINQLPSDVTAACKRILEI